MSATQCQSFLRNEKRCSRHAIDGKFCHSHSPYRKKIRAEEKEKLSQAVQHRIRCGLLCFQGMHDFWCQVGLAAVLYAYSERERRYLHKYRLGCSIQPVCMSHQIFGGYVPED